MRSYTYEELRTFSITKEQEGPWIASLCILDRAVTFEVVRDDGTELHLYPHEGILTWNAAQQLAAKLNESEPG